MDLSHPSPATLQAARHDWIWRARRSGLDLQRARSSDYRDPFARDRARLLHSAASRRLMGKSQVPGLLGSMLPRAWQTHVLEVSQLSRGMLRALQHLHAPGEPWLPWLPDVNLLEAVALGRSLGHAPFGPVGDRTLAELMREHGGFDPRWQALRLMQRLEPHTPGHGLDLTRRTLLGLYDRAMLALPTPGRDPAGLAGQDWLLQPLSERDRRALLGVPPHGLLHAAVSLDGSIVQLAEQLAHAVHEFDDALGLGAVPRAAWDAVVLDPGWAEAVDLQPVPLAQGLFAGPGPARRQAVGALVNALLISVDIEAAPVVDEPLLHHRAQWIAPAQALVASLQGLVAQAWAQAPQVAAASEEAGLALRQLWSLAWAAPDLLGLPAHGAQPSDVWARLLCDRLAGLTDAAALQLAHHGTPPGG
ncbi:hypothetical protein F7Q92_14835 [Ideonella dechloratans]|uniref:Phosphohydrolase-associated domain-containing protein n=1 Tax=Ideonella dechloratans TaxID=36863 RepID=A0A643F9L8_IDEDE|nr:hypothetical protein [Ideonella dechloratans]KAB0579328.1 hypothetical protein F7Q92_14835 [Ideonella dechloratans]UFU09758.1 hypothetical protein LRM40_15860 [Ideonella dechloratans]